jgi:hypothetical protein
MHIKRKNFCQEPFGRAEDFRPEFLVGLYLNCTTIFFSNWDDMLRTWGVPMQKPAELNLRAIPEESRRDDAQDDAYQDHVSLNSSRWNDIYEVFRPLYMAHDTRKVVLLLRSHYGFRTT